MAAVQLNSGLLVGFLFLATCLVVAVRSYLRSGGADGGRGGAAIPSPPALPVIGNLHQLGSGRHHRTLRELARRHGPLFQLRLGSVRALVVSSASVAEAVLRHQDHVFCGRPRQHTARATLYDCRDVAFSPYGERWRRLRRIAVVHLLSARRVDSFRALREEEIASFVNRVRAASGGGGVVNLTELIVGLTNAVVSRAAFGKKLGGVEPTKVRETMGELADLLETIAVSDVFPRLRWVDWATGLDARTKRTAAKLDEVLEMALRDHEQSRGDDDDDGGEARDLMDDLLSIANDGGGDHGYKLDRIDVKRTHLGYVHSRHRHNLQIDRMDDGRAHQEPSRNGESASRGETCRTRTWRRRRTRRRRRRRRQGGAAGEDDPPPGGDEGGNAPPPAGAAAHPARVDPGHGAPRLPRPGGDASDDQRVGDREGRGGVGERGGVPAGEVRPRRRRRRRRVLRRRRLPVHTVRPSGRSGRRSPSSRWRAWCAILTGSSPMGRTSTRLRSSSRAVYRLGSSTLWSSP